MSARHNGRKPVRPMQPGAVRRIASQINRMKDWEVYALTLSADRATRAIAERIAHERAEAYALNVELTALTARG